MDEEEGLAGFILRTIENRQHTTSALTLHADTWRAIAKALTPPAPSPLGELADVIAEYDSIVDRFDRADPEADFVMRGSDWREIRKALSDTPSETAYAVDAARYDFLRSFDRFALVHLLLDDERFDTLDKAVDHAMKETGHAPRR